MRENVSPKVIQQSAWAGANIGSYRSAAEAMQRLAGVVVTTKQVRRLTTDVGRAACREREQSVADHTAKPLVPRLQPRSDIEAPEVGVVMMDGGRLQRRDHFGQPPQDGERTTHWKEDKVGLCLSMISEQHEHDPSPEFPEWLAGAEVVTEIARLGQPETPEIPAEAEVGEDSLGWSETPWPEAPTLLSREVIASCQCGEQFGRHLEWKAWHSGITAAKRQAFVADGASVNWTIHQKHFPRMTPVLDLMHALSYAYRAAEWVASTQADRSRRATYAGWAEAIWQGRVDTVIAELETWVLEEAPRRNQDQASGKRTAAAEGPAGPSAAERALTYYRNHRKRMNYPEYRRRGLPLTSSLMESAIKQINLRVKGSEKFWQSDAAEAVLQLRADSLSDSHPLDHFWPRWHAQQDGTNRYRSTAA